MNINITSRKFKSNDSLKSHIITELKSLEKFNADILDADVILHFTHLKDSIKTAEIKLKLPKKTIVVTESSDEFFKSVSSGVSKLTRQLKQLKSKRISKVKP
ncbi:MAG: ribosomal subunit interface protein [Ignavibacteriae bacterium HGW-Ignavibacteriae-2]|jgi:putative sigma-54 modulation protein|nr:ribosome-associated translation inhibitor RaiA [Bacteroidota bacterium]PKL87487.1 MAG: ribosomal subunit interface protein [Ignavibacteriae bacterium HGW-Ignavibacteriae-2]